MARYKGTFTLDATPTTTSVILAWDSPKGPSPVYYDVIRQDALLATRGGTVFTYTDTAVTAGATYTYQIRGRGSYTAEGEALSNTVNVAVQAIPVPISAPVLTGTSGAAQASLSWTAVPNADSYSWQRATGAGAFGSSTDTALLTATDGTVASGTLYRFRVRGSANAGADTGPWSNIVSVTPTTGVPVAPTLTGEEGDSQNSLDWNSVANAATYRLRRQVGTDPITLFGDTAATDFIDDSAANDITYTYTVRGITAGGVFGSISAPVALTPVAGAVSPPEPSALAGYAAVAGVTGGGTVAATNVSTFAQLQTALEASGSRVVNLTGSGVLNGNGASITISNGNLTLDGTNWTGVLKNYKAITVRASNIILKELALRPGEGATATDSENRRALSFNPPTGGMINRIMIDHCSLAWSPHVNLWFSNRVEDVTVQYCIIGPGLYNSNIASSANGYGSNIETTAGVTQFPRRFTFYRNLIIMNKRRNLRGQHILGWDCVNNVIYDYGDKAANGNPQGANLMGNIFKKGPETSSSVGWSSELDDEATAYYQNSVYFAGNIGRTAADAAFTLTTTFGSNVKRDTVYDGGPGAADHGGLTVATADDTLLAAVIAGAGRSHEDAVDTLVKGYATDGTSDGYYNGAGFPAPHPSW